MKTMLRLSKYEMVPFSMSLFKHALLCLVSNKQSVNIGIQDSAMSYFSLKIVKHVISFRYSLMN